MTDRQKLAIQRVLLELDKNAFKNGYVACEIHYGKRLGEEEYQFITPYLERIVAIMEASDERSDS